VVAVVAAEDLEASAVAVISAAAARAEAGDIRDEGGGMRDKSVMIKVVLFFFILHPFALIPTRRVA
jgi:hypothetical protein